MTFRNDRALVGIAVMAALVAGLTNCSSDSPKAGRPDTDLPSSNSTSGRPGTGAPTTAASSTGSPTLTVTTPAPAPLRPADATGLTLAAGEAFVHYYSALMNYASDTGDVGPMLAESDGGCENCKVYTAAVRKSNAANGLLSGDYREKITEVSELTRVKNGRLAGSAVITVGRYVTRTSPDAAPFTTQPRTLQRQFALSPRAGNWVMFELQQRT